jgi:hypothetical protein
MNRPNYLRPEEFRKRIDNDARNMVDFPVLPQVYHQIVTLDKAPESDMQVWVSAVETDPLSAAQVITPFAFTDVWLPRRNQ